MGGAIENWLENLIVKIAKGPLSPLQSKGERQVASAHFFAHAYIGSIINIMALNYSPAIAYVTVGSVILVIIAEMKNSTLR